MRLFDIESNDHVVIHIADEVGQDGARHNYYLGHDKGNDDELVSEFGYIHFQNGPIKDFGVNGCQQEDLIAICIHRLQSFQSGDFECRENALAITKLEEALHWLKHRTESRIKRGVEGTNRL